MKCAIIDDEPLALGLLESYVAKTPMLELCGKYASAVEAMVDCKVIRSTSFSSTFRCLI